MRLLRGRSTPASRAIRYPCLCLCRWFSQITRTTPRRRMTLHLSHTTLTEALTFMGRSRYHEIPVKTAFKTDSCLRQHDRPVIGDGDRVLEMGGEATIFGYSRPPVVLDQDFGPPRVDHRLDRDHQPGGEAAALAGVPVVRDVRLLVHGPADAVPDELADDRVAVGLGMRLDGPAYVPQALAGHAGGYGALQGLARDTHQRLGGWGHVADRDGTRRIAAPAVLEGPEINGQNVTRLEHHVPAGDAVHHHLVDRGADHGGIGRNAVSPVAEERRLGFELPQPAGGDVIELPGRDPGLGGRLEHVEHVGHDQVCLAQLGNFGRALELDGHPDIAVSSGGRPRRCGRISDPCSRSRQSYARATWPVRSSRAPAGSWRCTRASGCERSPRNRRCAG